jgi:hypothetical protein
MQWMTVGNLIVLNMCMKRAEGRRQKAEGRGQRAEGRDAAILISAQNEWTK